MATSPKRILSFIFVISYYIFAVMRPFASASALRGRNIQLGATQLTLNYPLVQVLDAVLFGIFLIVSIPLLLQMAAYNRTMRAADIDVLFPTPVSPKLVMSLRVLRDYLATLILPIFLLILTWGPTNLSGILANLPHPETAGYVLRTTMLAWLLLAMVWTVYGYAATLFVNRSDLASDRNQRILKWTVSGIVLAAAAYVTLCFRSEGLSIPTALRVAGSMALRVPFFLAHLATAFSLGPLTGLWNSVLSGVALIGLLALGFAIALSEVGWMYDQAAVRGFETMESLKLRRSGDLGAILADSARRGKLRAGRQTWIHRLRVKPGAAMIWREAVIQVRTLRSSMILFALIAVAYSLMPVLIFRSAANGGATAGGEGIQAIGWLFSACQGFGLFMYIMSTTATGYVELLRRVDLMKPLPFSPAHLMVTEVLAKTYLPVAISLLCTAVATAACPIMWPYAVAHLMYGPSLAVMLSSTVLVITLLFSDTDDPTQRGFRGMMQLLAIAIAIAPGLGLYIALSAYGGGPILAAFIGMIVNLAITVALTVAAGFLYLGFNPSE